MFVRRIAVERVDAAGARQACPIAWIDNFAMRNFTNDAVFDDTLPVADGLLEAGNAGAARPATGGDGRLVPAEGVFEGWRAGGSGRSGQ